MSAIPPEIEARKGRSIPETWRNWQDWERGQANSFHGSPNSETATLPGGAYAFTPARDKRVSIPFFVLIGGHRVRVRPGRINGDIPRIGERLLTGEKVNAKTPEEKLDKQIPTLSLRGKRPNVENESWICVELKDYEVAENGARTPVFHVTHRSELILREPMWPLALLTWDATGSTVARTDQFVKWHLQYYSFNRRPFFMA